ncbi:hypothetical protein UB34_18955, partial [Photobacterium leiognathi]|uniref:hypothetical protein n=1 Tax=Photobacterium leiognathi TaxID=553611 RepID=UPI0005D441E5
TMELQTLTILPRGFMGRLRNTCELGTALTPCKRNCLTISSSNILLTRKSSDIATTIVLFIGNFVYVESTQDEVMLLEAQAVSNIDNIRKKISA